MSKIILSKVKGAASVRVVQLEPKKFVVVRRAGTKIGMWVRLSESFAVNDALAWLRSV